VAGADVDVGVLDGEDGGPTGSDEVPGPNDEDVTALVVGRWVGADVVGAASPGPGAGREGLCPVKLTIAAMPIRAAATARAATAITR
jgi:hypothetical protein